MPIERVAAELRGEDGKVYRVQLDITPGNPISVDELSTHAFRIPSNVKLSANSGNGVPDGTYVRTFVFDGRTHNQKVRMLEGRMQDVW